MRLRQGKNLRILFQSLLFNNDLQQCHFSSLKNKNKIGFVGLGNMGEKMCRNLIKKDYQIIVKDVDPKKEELLKKAGAEVAQKNINIAEYADVIITMLPASHHVTSFYIGENGIIKAVKPGTISIDCSTVDHTTPKYLSTILEKNGASIIDAPVSGGVPAALNGTLTFMVGGKQEDLVKAKPVLSCMGSNIIYCGELGSGQVAKICNNLLLAINMFGAAEIFHLGKKLGIDLNVLNSVVNRSSGKCWATDTYNPVPNIMENVPSSRNYEAGFTSEMILKDLEIAERAAKEINVTLNIGNQALEMYKKICDTDLKKKDFSVIYEYISKNNL